MKTDNFKLHSSREYRIRISAVFVAGFFAGCLVTAILPYIKIGF